MTKDKRVPDNSPFDTYEGYVNQKLKNILRKPKSKLTEGDLKKIKKYSDELSSEWSRLTDDDVNVSSYKPWLIDCPNKDCDSGITLDGQKHPSSLECLSCGTKIEIAVRGVPTNDK